MVYALQKSEEFDSIVEGNQIVVVDFFADWCGPCRAIAPTVEELDTQYTQLFADIPSAVTAEDSTPEPPISEEAAATETTPDSDNSATDPTASVQTKDKIKFIKVDVDGVPELAERMGVTAMPTFLIFVDGQLQTTIIGASKPKLEAAIKSAVESIK